MHVILFYDVEVERVQKIHKLMKRYLTWVQNSVFEGEMTEGKMEEMKSELRKKMNPGLDSVIIYKLGDLRYTEREIVGVEKNTTDNLL
ncbi:MAG: CRISPR-associated endonuclease Cas2 [Candidatus Wallbacteria bacterium]|nr:CRISPR-associated endonuclease Cas2 [Candidatus Wallbacteria bacterium]